MNIYLKEISLEDGEEFGNLLIELSRYQNVYARPVPSDFEMEEFESFKRTRVKMAIGKDLPSHIKKTSTYWVMDGNIPIGYATLKHEIDMNKPGGHFGLCLKEEYQNKGLGTVVSDLLSEIAYKQLEITEVIFTSKNENIQSQKSVDKIGGTLIKVQDGYHYYSLDLVKKFENSRRI